MRGIAGFVSDGALEETDALKNFKEMIGDQSGGWKGFEGESVLVGCCGCGENLIASNERFACLFDGMIYNHDEVYELLMRGGHSFEEKNNAQMMMHAFMEWGEECVSRIKGVFLAVIWDDDAKSLFLTCDKMGQKPLYYAKRDNTFVFASHVNLLMQYCGVEPIIDGVSIAELIGLYPLRTPEFGILKGVSKLRPAHFIRWSGGDWKIRRYWSIESKPHTDNLATTAQRVRFMVKDAIARHLKGNENVCSLLSGGVSSTANSAIAANYLAFLKGERIDTYSFDFKEADKNLTKSTTYQNSDKQWAERVCKEFYTKHRHLVSSAQDVLNTFDGLCDEGNFFKLPIYESVFSEVYNIIGRRNSALLSGMGIDDVFWDNYVEGMQWESILKEREAILTPEMAFYADTKNYFEKRYEKEMDKMPRFFAEGDEKRRTHAYLMLNWKLFHEVGNQTALAREQGLALRLPLCDDQLLEYVWNIPYAMKTLGGRDKGIFRLAMKGILPDDVLERRKRPCPMPYTQWLEDTLIKRLEALLYDPEAPISQIISKDVLKIKGVPLAYSPSSLPAVELYAFLLQLNSWMELFHVKVS